MSTIDSEPYFFAVKEKVQSQSYFTELSLHCYPRMIYPVARYFLFKYLCTKFLDYFPFKADFFGLQDFLHEMNTSKNSFS
jgi:hypothetical protein